MNFQILSNFYTFFLLDRQFCPKILKAEQTQRVFTKYVFWLVVFLIWSWQETVLAKVGLSCPCFPEHAWIGPIQEAFGLPFPVQHNPLELSPCVVPAPWIWAGWRNVAEMLLLDFWSAVTFEEPWVSWNAGCGGILSPHKRSDYPDTTPCEEVHACHVERLQGDRGAWARSSYSSHLKCRTCERWSLLKLASSSLEFQWLQPHLPSDFKGRREP